MLDEDIADCSAGSRHKVDHAGGKSHILHNLNELPAGQRRIAGRLEDHRVARRDSGHRRPHEDRKREIPRGDDDSDAERNIHEFPFFTCDLHHPVISSVPEDLPSVVLEEINRLGSVGVRLSPALPHFKDHDSIEVESAFPHQLRPLEQEVRPPCERDILPLLKCGSGGVNRPLGHGTIPFLEDTDNLSRLRRVQRMKLLGKQHPFAADHDRILFPEPGPGRGQCLLLFLSVGWDRPIDTYFVPKRGDSHIGLDWVGCAPENGRPGEKLRFSLNLRNRAQRNKNCLHAAGPAGRDRPLIRRYSPRQRGAYSSSASRSSWGRRRLGRG